MRRSTATASTSAPCCRCSPTRRPTAAASSPPASSSRAIPRPASTMRATTACSFSMRSAPRSGSITAATCGSPGSAPRRRASICRSRCASAPTSRSNTPRPPWARRCRRMPTRSRSPAGLPGGRFPVVKAVSQDLLVPADTEIVLEGVIRTDETVLEGPFGEFVGYLANAEDMPIVEVTALTHRRRPVYHAINGYGRETIMLRKYVLEASLLKVLGAAVPCVIDAEMTAGGLHRFHAIIQVKKSSPRPRRAAAQRYSRGVRRAQGSRPRHRGRSRHRHPRSRRTSNTRSPPAWRPRAT